MVLPEQDTLAEAATIHRSASLMNLHTLMAGNAAAWGHGPPNPHVTTAANTALIDGIATAANIPSENEYRAAIGLSPRQDHRALILTGGHYQMGSWNSPINVV